MPSYLSIKQKVGLILVLTMNFDEDRTHIRAKKRRLQRKNLGHVALVKELESVEFQNILRMDQDCFCELLNLVKPYITKQDTLMRRAVSAEERLVVTLKYLATGRDYKELTPISTVISPQLMSKIIPETCEAICKVLRKYTKVPATEEEWLEIAKQYEDNWQFHHCVGSMDAKHIQIAKPADSGSMFYNYKGTFSVILFAIVNANYEFLYINAGMNGSLSGSTVLRRTKFYEKLIDNDLNLPKETTLPNSNTLAPYVFLADNVFPLERNILKPYPQKDLTKEMKIFNYRISRARRVVDNAFGVLASRFRIFQRAMSVKNLDTVDKIIMASCHLHNYLRHKSANYITPLCVDYEDTVNGSFRQGQWREQEGLFSLHDMNQSHETETGQNVQNIFNTYFNGPGCVQFQKKMIDVIDNNL